MRHKSEMALEIFAEVAFPWHLKMHTGRRVLVSYRRTSTSEAVTKSPVSAGNHWQVVTENL